MADIVLFHHVLGLTDGVRAIADRLRDAGHTVHTPDLFEGQVFPDIETGFGLVQQIGVEELTARAERAVAELPAQLVYGGFSLGVVPAQTLLQSRPGARAGLFLHSFLPPAELPGTWPDDIPVHVYGMEQDPFFAEEGDLAAAEAWQAEHPNLQIHTWPGRGHLFTDATTEDHDAAVTDELVAQVLDVLAGL